MKHIKAGGKIAKEGIKILFFFFSYQCNKDFKVILRSGEDVFLLLGSYVFICVSYILIHLHKLLKFLNFLDCKFGYIRICLQYR